MYRQLIDLFGCILPVLFVSGCGFVDLRPIEYGTIPEKEYEVIPEPYSAVGLHFNTPMNKMESKSAVQILSPSGSVEGDFIWEENDLLFVPESPWIAGIRYVMKLSGTVSSKDGRDLSLSRELPFYAISRSAMPYLESFSPEEGASTGVFGPDEVILIFNFSEPMDRQSTEMAFNCEGIRENDFEWRNDDKTLLIVSKKPLSPWTSCRWTISEKALSRLGAPLAKEFSGRFFTDEDRSFPYITRVLPLIKSKTKGPWGYWMPLALDLENGLGHEQALGIEFSKEMDGESLRRAFSFEPPLPGRTEQPGPSRAVFIPDRNTDPETSYTMKISRELRDSGGLKLEDDFSLSFSSDIPFLKIYSFSADSSGTQSNPAHRDVFTAPIDDGDGVLRFTIFFSLPFSEEEQKEAPFRISLQPYFPGILRPVSLRFSRWITPNQLRMEWEGLGPGKAGEPHFYKLNFPGGRNGLSNGNGSYLKEETYFIIEAADK